MSSLTRPLGHQATIDQFLAGISTKKLHHAWLLHGPAGIGKAMLAELLAASYLCERNHDSESVAEACGECHTCRMLAAGAHPDRMSVNLLEKKRDISVGQIRDALTFLSLSGMESHRRVVIIDDAEQLNTQAANALLKRLEEPSKGSLLLIVCSDVTKLPATIRSRCLLAPCHPLSEADTKESLEQMGIPKAAMQLAVELAEGCPGRVVCLHDETSADALAEWQRLLQSPEKSDIGAMEKWMGQHLQQLPYQLIVDMVFKSLWPQLTSKTEFSSQQRIDEALRGLAAWPGQVSRHSLRPVPSLLAHMLRLRIVLRT